MGGHCVGVWHVPTVYYQEQNRTGEKPQCLSGSNHTDSDYSNHIPADLLLLDISVSVYIYTIYANVCEWACVYTTGVHYVLV